MYMYSIHVFHTHADTSKSLCSIKKSINYMLANIILNMSTVPALLFFFSLPRPSITTLLFVLRGYYVQLSLPNPYTVQVHSIKNIHGQNLNGAPVKIKIG